MPTPTHQLIHPPNRLRTKVRGDGFAGESLARAEAALQEFAGHYTALAEREVRRLRDHLAALEADAESSASRLRQLHLVVFDFKGLGAAFGFPLLSRVGNSLCRFTEELEAPSPADLALVRAHVDAIAAIVAGGIRGDGGEIGRAVIDGLETAVRRFRAARGEEAGEDALPDLADVDPL